MKITKKQPLRPRGRSDEKRQSTKDAIREAYANGPQKEVQIIPAKKDLVDGRLLHTLPLLSLPSCGSQKIPQQLILHSQSLDLVCLLRDNISGRRIFSWPSFRPWRDSGFHLCLFVVIPVDPILDL